MNHTVIAGFNFEIHNVLAYKFNNSNVLSKSDNPWLSYWWLNKFSYPFLGVELLSGLFLTTEWTGLNQIYGGHISSQVLHKFVLDILYDATFQNQRASNG